MQSVALAVVFLVAAANAQLWGVTHQNQLAFLDTDNGLWTLAGEAFSDRHIITLIQVADIDESANTFYIAAINRTDTTVGLELIGLSAVSGQIVSEVVLPFRFSFNYVDTPGVDYIPGSHDVLVYGANVDGLNYDIFRVTPVTGKVVKITSWAKTNGVIQSVDAFDSANNILWIQIEANNALSTLGFDILTGALAFNTTDSYGLQSLNFDTVKKQVVGLGKPNNGNTPIITLNGATGAYAQIGQITGSYTIAGPDNAGFDDANRILYLYVDNGSEVELLAVNVDQGTSATVAFTPGSSVVPTTIAFFNV